MGSCIANSQMGSYQHSSQKRNIVVVGLSDTDKCVITNQILQLNNGEYDNQPSISYDQPRKCKIIFEEDEKKLEYEVAIIDLPEIDPNSIKKSIEDIIEMASSNFSDGIHLVAFVVKFGRIDHNVRRAISQFFELAKNNIRKTSALIVFSRSDMNETTYTTHMQEINKDLECANNMLLGCHYVYFTDTESKIRSSHSDDIGESRSTLQKLILNANTPCRISLTWMSKIKRGLSRFFHCCYQICRSIFRCFVSALWFIFC